MAFLGFACLYGCGNGRDVPAVTVTNRVTVAVTVTNVVTERVTVTNVVTEFRAPGRRLSPRRTAPYAVTTRSLDASRLWKLLSDTGARVIECESGAVATVEAPDKVVEALTVGGVVDVRELKAADKVSADLLSAKSAVAVRIVPLSSIDAAAVESAVAGLGGKLSGRSVSSGCPAVRATIDGRVILELAGRGDVRRIEREQK